MAAVHRQDRAGRVLHGRDRVDVFGHGPFALQLVEDLRQRVEAQAVIVERRADDIDAEALQLADRPAIGEFLEDHGVAAVEQHPVDQVEALAGAGGDQHLVGRAVDAAPVDLVDDEVAGGAEALRPMRVVERQIGPLAPQHRLGRRRQGRRRDVLAVVMAADEIVFGKAGPARRRRRQILGKQMAVGETGGGHGSFLFGPEIRPSPAMREREGPGPQGREGEGSRGGAVHPHPPCYARHPLPRCGRGDWRQRALGACLPESCGVMSG